jgi:nitroreductase
MVIAAESLGLGSVFIGDILFHAEKVSKILKLHEMVLPLLLFCIGYPSEDPPIRARWPIDSILSIDQYREITNEEIEFYLKHNYMQLQKEHHKTSEEIKKEFLKDLKSHMDKTTHRKHDPQLAKYLRKTGFLPKY